MGYRYFRYVGKIEPTFFLEIAIKRIVLNLHFSKSFVKHEDKPGTEANR